MCFMLSYIKGGVLKEVVNVWRMFIGVVLCLCVILLRDGGFEILFSNYVVIE